MVCFTNGRLLNGWDWFVMRGDRRGVGEIVVQNILSCCFCCLLFGSNQTSGEVRGQKSSWHWRFGPAGCGSLWSAPTAGNTIGNESFRRKNWPGYQPGLIKSRQQLGSKLYSLSPIRDWLWFMGPTPFEVIKVTWHGLFYVLCVSMPTDWLTSILNGCEQGWHEEIPVGKVWWQCGVHITEDRRWFAPHKPTVAYPLLEATGQKLSKDTFPGPSHIKGLTQSFRNWNTKVLVLNLLT
jgi:hypothetical protein